MFDSRVVTNTSHCIESECGNRVKSVLQHAFLNLSQMSQNGWVESFLQRGVPDPHSKYPHKT
jgi:hypothetical protein